MLRIGYRYFNRQASSSIFNLENFKARPQLGCLAFLGRQSGISGVEGKSNVYSVPPLPSLIRQVQTSVIVRSDLKEPHNNVPLSLKDVHASTSPSQNEAPSISGLKDTPNDNILPPLKDTVAGPGTHYKGDTTSEASEEDSRLIKELVREHAKTLQILKDL